VFKALNSRSSEKRRTKRLPRGLPEHKAINLIAESCPGTHNEGKRGGGERKKLKKNKKKRRSKRENRKLSLKKGKRSGGEKK